ncbi:alpha/beta-type small acid-soluble spore protein [Proteinivorax hydrogeniformans]|uniref:Alpha/beta-type small acid-soluble spore protein n=1 Tax=Proteinivorax hydrogeniformans TaxID=1826727 RepID=A0AAU8HR79_9FIRM
MARKKRHVLPEAEQTMERFKYETAAELGLADKIRTKGWKNMTTKECGMIGGQMVKKMIAKVEKQYNS